MGMKAIILSVAEQFSFRQVSKATTTDFTFNIITRTTPKLLLVIALFIIISQLLRNPIECGGKPVETLCWISGTHLSQKHLTGTPGEDVVNYGIVAGDKSEDRIYQTHYQWVIPSLLFMALIFYIPNIVWRHWENGTMDELLKDIDFSNIQEEGWSTQRERFLRNFEGSKNLCRVYATKYYLCEVIALVALIYNVYVLSVVFDNFWITLFPAVRALINHDLNQFAKESNALFPSQAKCSTYSYLYGNDVSRDSHLCTLPQNVINKKIFALLYLWIVLLLIFTVSHIICLMAELIYQSKKQKDFGYYFVKKILKKNLDSAFVEELFEAKK